MLVQPVAGFFKQRPFSTVLGAILIAGVAGFWSGGTDQSPRKLAADFFRRKLYVPPGIRRPVAE